MDYFWTDGTLWRQRGPSFEIWKRGRWEEEIPSEGDLNHMVPVPPPYVQAAKEGEPPPMPLTGTGADDAGAYGMSDEELLKQTPEDTRVTRRDGAAVTKEDLDKLAKGEFVDVSGGRQAP